MSAGQTHALPPASALSRATARPAVGLRNRLRDRVELLLLAAGGGDARAQRRQFMRGAPADAAARAGDDSRLSGKQSVTKHRLETGSHGLAPAAVAVTND